MKMKHFNSLSEESIPKNVCSGNPFFSTEKIATTVMHVAHSQQSEIQIGACHHEEYLGSPHLQNMFQKMFEFTFETITFHGLEKLAKRRKDVVTLQSMGRHFLA